MSASWLLVHSWQEKISQTRNKAGNLDHFWTGGLSIYHQPMYYNFGLGCQETDCEMNNFESKVYKNLRAAGY